MKNLTTKLISTYQKYISANRLQSCKYYPSCSNYTILAVEEFGVRGLFMSTWRLIRCNPFSNGGVDYPSESSKERLKARLKERLMA